MKMLRLDHVNVKTTNLKEMVHFYENILGLTSGPRPNFPFPGAWMYIDEHPIVHLVSVEEECKAIDPKIEHFAIQATGLSGLIQKLTEAEVAHSIDPVPGVPIVQVNLADSDGNHIHIDFHSDELTTMD